MSDDTSTPTTKAADPFPYSFEPEPVIYPWRATNQETKDFRDSNQWLRKIDLTLFDDTETTESKGSALNLTPDTFHQFQVTFQIRKAMAMTPNLMTCRIYNLSNETLYKIQAYRQVQLSAGYRGAGNFGVIFKGAVAQYKRGKENAVNSYVEIVAGDGNVRLPFDVIRAAWPAGTSMETVTRDAISKISVPAGDVDVGKGGKDEIARGYSVNTSMVNFFRQHGASLNVDFYVDDGKFHAIPRTGYRPGEAVVLTPASGLIGVPEVTPQGIQIQCLLNPKLRLGGLVKIEEKFLSGVQFMPGSGIKGPLTQSQQEEQLLLINRTTWSQQRTLGAFTSPVGTYKILFMDIVGETRGNPWYNNLVCVALDESGEALQSPNIAFGRIAPEVKATLKIAPLAPQTLERPLNPPTRMRR